MPPEQRGDTSPHPLPHAAYLPWVYATYTWAQLGLTTIADLTGQSTAQVEHDVYASGATLRGRGRLPRPLDGNWLAHAYHLTGRNLDLVAEVGGAGPYEVAEALVDHHRVGYWRDFADVALEEPRWWAQWPQPRIDTVANFLTVDHARAKDAWTRVGRTAALPAVPRPTEEQITAAVENATSQAGVALQLGRSRTWVGPQIKRRGLDVQTQRAPTPRLLDDAEFLERAWTSFSNLRVLAPLLGTPEQTLSEALRRHGIRTSPERPSSSLDPEKVAAMLADGRTHSDIAAALGTTRQRISEMGVKLGLSTYRKRPGPARRYPQLADPDWLEAALARHNGSQAAIASEVGASAALVARECTRFGIPRRNDRCDRPDLLTDRDWLADRHINQRTTTYDIAREIGCSWHLVRNRLDRYAIVQPADKRDRRLHDANWLLHAHHQDDRRVVCIADEVGVGVETIEAALDEAELLRPVSAPSAVHRLLRDQAWLGKQLAEGHTSAAIASMLATDPATVQRAVAELDADASVLDDASALSNLVCRGLDVGSIAKRAGTTPAVVAKALDRHGVAAPARLPLAFDTTAKLDDRDWLDTQYHGLRRSMRSIAADLGCDRLTVRKALERHGIAISSERRRAIRHPLLGDREWLAAQFAAGRSDGDIADEVGCDPSYVSSRRQIFGLVHFRRDADRRRITPDDV